MKKRYYKLIFLLLLIIFIPLLSNAKSSGNSSLSVTSIPEIPRPNKNVSLSIESFSFNLNKAYISWSVDGVQKLVGIGKTSFSFKTGNVGVSSVIRISVSVGGGFDIITKNIHINPAEIDLLTDAINSYTPPFYKGKALASSNAIVKIVAVPNMVENGVRLPSKNIVYSWSWNGNKRDIIDQSGYGKNTIFIKKDMLRSNERIEVVASSISGSTRARSIIYLFRHKPKIIFYEKKALRGTLYEKALSNKISIGSGELTVVAEPYFFSTNNLFDSVNIDWKMNGKSIKNSEKESNTITFTTNKKTKGTSTISVYIKHISKILQSASNSMAILLNNTSNNASFGL